eukprot:10702717-Prorocentrum_lima.AAC.1
MENCSHAVRSVTSATGTSVRCTRRSWRILCCTARSCARRTAAVCCASMGPGKSGAGMQVWATMLGGFGG